MKTLLSWKFIALIVILFLFFVRCSEDNPTEPNYDAALTANWKISNLSWEGQNEKGSYDQSELDSLGTIWNLVLRSDKTVEQTTNYCCALSTHTGTWSATEYELTLKLKASNSNDIVTTVYQFVIEESKLVLDWHSTTGTIYFAEFTKQ